MLYFLVFVFLGFFKEILEEQMILFLSKLFGLFHIAGTQPRRVNKPECAASTERRRNTITWESLSPEVGFVRAEMWIFTVWTQMGENETWKTLHSNLLTSLCLWSGRGFCGLGCEFWDSLENPWGCGSVFKCAVGTGWWQCSGIAQSTEQMCFNST